MNFDGTRYRDEYLKKVNGKRALPDDLVERYAISLPASDSEISAQVSAVRSYWNGFKPGSRGSDVVRLCRSADEQLNATVGRALLTQKFWTDYVAQKTKSSTANVAKLSERLKSAYGRLGVVAQSTLDSLAAPQGLTSQQALEASKQAGLRVVAARTLPVESPISVTRFQALENDLQVCGARTIPELLHPGCGSFKILDGFFCLKDRNKRLDLAALELQTTAAQKTSQGTANDARRSALQSLQTAARDKVELVQVALAHFVDVAKEVMPEGLDAVQDALVELGVDAGDAAEIVIALADQATSANAAGVARVEHLLGAGRLGEASQAAQNMPSGSEQRAKAIKKVDEARSRLDALMTQARSAVASGHEAAATSFLREAALISADDAAEALAAVPLPPAVDVRAVGDGDSVKLHWQPNTGHGNGTSYAVIRSEARAPATPADGREIGRGSDKVLTDTHVPVAREVHYSVFTFAAGRPSSRAASVSILIVPPVSNPTADVGPGDVTIHWSAHPECHSVEAFQIEAGTPKTPLAVSNNSSHVGGLVEGKPLHFELTAVYRGKDGGVLRSPAVQISATPRSEASPIGKLRTRAIDAAGEVKIRVSWTPVDKSEVRILRSTDAPPWGAGSWITYDDMARYGTEVSGRRVTGRSEIAIEAELPPGVHHLVPVSIGGTGIVVGASAVAGVTDPVTRLRATPFGTYATVSWEWPPTSQLAEVTWEVDGELDLFVIGKSDYQTQGGARVPLGRSPSKVEVRAMIQAFDASFTSPPAKLEIAAVSNVEIDYRVASAPSLGKFGGRTKKVTFTSREGCQGVQVRMVASPGPVLPTSPNDSFVLLDVALDLPPGGATTHSVTVPRAVSRPYWVRCFIVGGRGRLVDPPITELKE